MMEGWEDGHVGDLSLLGGPWGASKVGGGVRKASQLKCQETPLLGVCKCWGGGP